MLFTNSSVLERMRGWSAGTTASAARGDLQIAPFVLIGLLIAALSPRALDVLLGDAAAVAMGAIPSAPRRGARRDRALAGARRGRRAHRFIGLLAPHLARMLVGPHQG